MAITQVGTTVEQGITYGVSKWCDVLFSDGDWKPSELAKYSWSRWRDKYIGCCDATSTDIHTQQGPAVTQLLSYFNSSLSETSNNYVTYYNDNRIPTNEPYCFNILMYGRDGDLALTSDNADKYRVVTSCSDFQSLYVLVNRYQSAQSTINVDYPTARTVNCNNLLWADNGVYNTINNTHTQWISVWTVFVIDEDNFFVTRGMAFPGRTPCMYDGVMGAAQGNIRPSNILTIGYGNRITDSKWYYYYGDITNYQKSTHLLRWYKNGITDIDPQTWGDSKYGVYDVDDDVAIIIKSSNAVYGTMSFDYTYYLKSEEAVKNAIAYTGLRWRYQNGDTEHIYTPIIDDDGYITGYSTDPAAVTKLNDIEDVTGNNIAPYPPIPPSPSGDDSDWDNIPINGGGIGGGSAFCRFYYCTEAELANLRTWTMGLSSGGDTIPAGFDPKSNIIGLTVFPFTVSGSGPTTIKFVTNGGIDPITTQEMPRVVDSGVACEGGAGNTVRILNTTIDVPAAMKSRGEPWLDYESYIELYIPMCGIYQVDPQVCIGRTIHVEIFLDPVSGTVMGIAWVAKDAGKCVIAQGSGTPGVQIPVTVGNYGLSQAARVQNTLGGFGNTATSAISTQMVSNTFQGQPGDRGLNGVRRISQPNDTAGRRIAAFNSSGGGGSIASSVLGFSGLLSSINHWVSSRQIANSPGTSASGGFSGSMAEWCGVFTPYVKIVRPKFRKPNNYKHTCGEPEVTARTLDTVGYAVCINPDISGLTNATEAERAAIYQLLSTGVYYK